MMEYTLKADTPEAMQAALAALGFDWDGQSNSLRTEQFEFAFFGTVVREVEGEPTIIPGFHADAIGPADFDFGDLEVKVEGPRYHTFA